MDKILGISAALGCACSWALGTVLLDKICSRFSALALTLVKGVMGLVFLGIALAFIGWTQIDTPTTVLLLISGVIGIGIGDTLFFMALKNLGASALIVMMMVGQVLTAIGALLFLGEEITPVRWTGILIVLLGVALVLWSRKEEDSGGATTWKGALWGFLSILCMSASLLIAKRGLEATPSLQATFIRMAAGTVTVIILGIIFKTMTKWVAPIREPGVLGNLTASVVVVTFGGFWLSLHAVKHLDVSLANSLMATEPLFALPLAWILMRTPLQKWTIIGSICTVIGVGILCTT